MTARRLRAGACGALLAGLCAAGHAAADTRLVRGDLLVLTTSLSDGVVIGTDPALSGHIRLSMDGSLSCLSVSEDHAAVIGTSGCDDDAGKLRIEVSPDTLVTLTSTGDGDVRVATLHGLLVATLNGSGNLVGERTGGLVLAVHADGDATLGEVDGPATLSMTGSGDVRLSHVRGPMTVRQAGSGDLTVGGIEASAVDLDGAGSGDMLLGAGQVDTLHARMAGSGDLSVAAAVRDADVQAHGSSDVRLASVSGTFNHAASGEATVRLVGTQAAGTIASAAARKLGHADEGEGGDGWSALRHVLMAGVLGLVLFVCWRIARRPGGFAGLRARAGQAPSHPSVVALGETMARLDQRLGQIESYVTTREFDLARKFREL